MKPTLLRLLKSDEAKRLEAALASKGESPVLTGLGTPENTMRFMRACMRGSYLFGRHVVPTYVAHAFSTLTNYAPANDTIGQALRGLVDMCVGELSTNNIYNRRGECHAHFNDLREAYAEAGCDTEEFTAFMDKAEQYGTQVAIVKSPGLWSDKSSQFAFDLLECCADPLASFILMPCNEMLTTIIYPVAIKHLCAEARFAKFRRFLEVHIELDGNDHGIVALEWLDLYLKETKVPQALLSKTTAKVLALYE